MPGLPRSARFFSSQSGPDGERRRWLIEPQISAFAAFDHESQPRYPYAIEPFAAIALRTIGGLAVALKLPDSPGGSGTMTDPPEDPTT
ncbi:hypothetical protein C9417_27240 [Rhizobium sp. SEMIA 4088]|nr:hypothetical protein C9417_27240 [Rhizobium sp. SEMIA 4088]